MYLPKHKCIEALAFNVTVLGGYIFMEMSRLNEIMRTEVCLIGLVQLLSHV